MLVLSSFVKELDVIAFVTNLSQNDGMGIPRHWSVTCDLRPPVMKGVAVFCELHPFAELAILMPKGERALANA